MSENIIAGRYRVLKNKGDNGLCTTHYVEDSLNGMRLVVKVFTDSDPVALEYIKTANLLRDSEPSGIILALDSGLIEEPAGFYLAYPLQSGHSLDDYLRVAASLTTAELERLIISLTQALGQLHERGFVHLFLNPHNILYAPGAEIHLKDPALHPDFFAPLLERLTSYDYSFFSPELMDSTDGAGPSADLFALGRVIENALAHMERDTLKSETRQSCMQFRNIATHCLELNPQARYPDTAAVLEAIADQANSRPIGFALPASESQVVSDSERLTGFPLESSFFDSDPGILNESEEDFGILQPARDAAVRRKAGKRLRRDKDLPWLKLIFLGASLAAAIFILVMARNLPSKSARTSESPGAYAEETDTSGLPEGMGSSGLGATAGEQDNTGQTQPVLSPSGAPEIANTSGGQTGADEIVAEAGAPQQLSPDVGEPLPAVSQPPVALFVSSPDSGSSPLQVYLDASGSYDPDGSITSFAWSFGGSGVGLYHVFEGNILPCSIPVTLTVTDEQGLSASVTHYVTIY